MENDVSFYDFMADIETTDTDSGKGAILQAAMVAFNYDTGEIGPSICVNMWMPPTRRWDEGTRSWWANQHPDVFRRVTENPIHPRDGMLAIQKFVRETSGALYQPRLWAKPLTFEWPWFESYFREFEVDNPFHFRDGVDMQSFIRGMRGQPGAPAFDREVPMVGDAHHALDDSFHQLAVILTAKQKFGAPENADG